MLTPKQKNLLDYICKFINNNGYAPSYDEMTYAMCLKSKSGINRMIVALEERGFIRRIPNRARCIEVIKTKLETLDKKPVSVNKRIYYKGVVINSLNRADLLTILEDILDGFRTN